MIWPGTPYIMSRQEKFRISPHHFTITHVIIVGVSFGRPIRNFVTALFAHVKCSWRARGSLFRNADSNHRWWNRGGRNDPRTKARSRSLYLGRTTNECTLEPFRHCSNCEPSPSMRGYKPDHRSDPDRRSRSRTAGLVSDSLITQGHDEISFVPRLCNPYPIGGSKFLLTH